MAQKKPSIDEAKKLLSKATKKPVKKAVKKAPKVQPTKIDWTLAQQWYLMDATRTLSDVAKEFGVSRNSVTVNSTRMGWTELRNKLSETATNLMMKRLAKVKVAANDRHVSNYRTLQNKIMLAVDNLSAESDTSDMLSLAKALKTASDGERVALGLPTLVNAISDTEGRDFATAFADAWINAGKVLNGEGGTRRG